MIKRSISTNYLHTESTPYIKNLKIFHLEELNNIGRNIEGSLNLSSCFIASITGETLSKKCFSMQKRTIKYVRVGN